MVSHHKPLNPAQLQRKLERSRQIKKQKKLKLFNNTNETNSNNNATKNTVKEKKNNNKTSNNNNNNNRTTPIINPAIINNELLSIPPKLDAPLYMNSLPTAINNQQLLQFLPNILAQFNTTQTQFNNNNNNNNFTSNTSPIITQVAISNPPTINTPSSGPIKTIKPSFLPSSLFVRRPNPLSSTAPKSSNYSLPSINPAP